MSAELFLANTLRIAAEDLSAARLLAKAGNRNAIYHCEQAAEKIILAVLTSEKIQGERGKQHRLDALTDLVPDANPLKPGLRSIQHLAAYATTFRYATTAGRIKPPPTAAELDAEITKLAAVLADAMSRFGVDEKAPNSPAARATPLR